MSNTDNGEVPTGARPTNDPPMTMEELLGKIHNDWKLARKDQAIARLLTAMAMISQGTAEAMKTANQAMQVARVALDNTEDRK